MLIRQWRSWPENAIVPEIHHPVDPTKDWVPSPVAQSTPLPSEATPIGEQDFPQTKSKETIRDRKLFGRHDKGDPFNRKASRLSIRYWRDRLGSKRRKPEVELVPLPSEERKQATAADWRAYGYWARPRINGVMVRNATPPPVPRKLDPTQVEAVMHSIIDPDGVQHPDDWIAGVEHPSLPPRPLLWSPLSPQSAPPPSSELQLNPFLEHRRFGAAPLLFDMRRFYAEYPMIEMGHLPPGEDIPISIPVFFNVLGPNGAQPATYPGVSSVKITMLADDPLPVFPWPFIVNSHHESLPVTMCDVLCAIRDNFKERMTQEEVDSLNQGRRDLMFQAYWARTGAMCSGDDGVRRIDYLGGNYMFRGLEPAPDGEGLMLFVGPP